jgi:signal transduction histidine kinase
MTQALVQEFVANQRAPLRLWLGPSARSLCERFLREHFQRQAEIQPVPSAGELRGPAVLVLAAEDLRDVRREALLDVARHALPGRPVVVGGSNRKETLLDAINVWHAFRVLPADVPRKAIAEAVRAAHEAMSLDLAIELAARQLRDECRRLGCAVEELRATQERLMHAERLTTVGRIVGTLLAHAREPLNTLESFKTAHVGTPVDDVLAVELQCATEGIDGFATLLKDMLDLTENRPIKAELRPEPLDPLVERAVSLFTHDPLARGRDIVSICRSNATVLADRPRLVHVLLNLLRNAAQATELGDRIEVLTRREDLRGVIEVRDFGHGMTPEVLERIFTPFFTTKGRAGMGLGLRLSRTAIEANNGTLECTSEPGQGTCFAIRLSVVG